MIVMAYVKTRLDFYIFISVSGILGILICIHSLKFEYKHEKLEILR